jgi:hypothetical protein
MNIYGRLFVGINLVAGLTLAGCSAPTVLSTPNTCSTLIPESWKAGVAGAELPADDTVGSWVAFGDAQTARLDQANGRTRDTIEIVSRCEDRDRKAVERSTRSWLGRLFN